MNLSPALQRAIEQIASSQGISAEQFIIRTLMEKVSSLQQSESTVSTSQTGLREEDGILVFNTESLEDINFNALIAQSLEERALEQMRL